MKPIIIVSTLTFALGISLASSTAAEPTNSGEILTDWNKQLLAIAETEDGFLTLKGLRSAAMMHAAIHDALNAIEPRFSTYLATIPTPKADPIAATAQAAFEIATQQYPDHRDQFEVALAGWLDRVADGPPKTDGIALGRDSALAILKARRDDDWDGEASYRWHPMGPGVYAEFQEHSGTPEGFVFGAGWAKAKPFMLTRAAQFRVPPPPPIRSDSYAAAFNEVKTLGGSESTTRTEDQAHLAMWWKDFVENSHNRLARQLVVEEDMELWSAARMFALLNMSIFDAYVNVFDNKFFYNHWRPYTAIRWAANDGNDDTEPDLRWDNLHHHTYAFPSYPSAHGTACATAMTVLADSFGSERAVTMTTEVVDEAGPMSGKIPMDPPTRTFENFSDAATECGASRIYLGIHFRYDAVAAKELGDRIGEFAVGHFLQPVKEKASDRQKAVESGRKRSEGYRRR